MGHTTDIGKSARMVRILAHLIRRRPHKFTVQEIHSLLSRTDQVSLRNIQRDLKELSDIPESCVATQRSDRRLRYFIEPDIRTFQYSTTVFWPYFFSNDSSRSSPQRRRVWSRPRMHSRS